jgi:hypothetical protein
MFRDAYDELERLREAVHKNPQDETRVVDLVIRCLSLAEGPGDMIVWDMHRILSRDANDPEVDRFTHALAEATAPRGVEGEVSLGKDVLQDTHPIFPQNLPNWSGKYATEAQRVLDRFLEKNPRNARVWLVYLANCDQFVPGAYTQEPRKWTFMGRGQSPKPIVIPPKQKETIEFAYVQCPEDEGIKAWHNFVTSGNPIPPEKAEQLRERLRNSSSCP